MSKAILVLKMPESCDMCYLCRIRRYGRYCVVTKQSNTRVGCVPDYCPLRPIPDKEVFAVCANDEVIFIEPPKIDDFPIKEEK